MRVDGTFLAVNGKSNFDGTFTAVTQHDGKFFGGRRFPFYKGNFWGVDGNSNLDGKSPIYRDRPPVRYFYVRKFTDHLSGNFNEKTKTAPLPGRRREHGRGRPRHRRERGGR